MVLAVSFSSNDNIEVEQAPSCAPHLRLFSDTVEVADRYGAAGEMLRLPLAKLSFQYGPRTIGADDTRSQFFVGSGQQMQGVPRDTQGERQARVELERLGLVDVTCDDAYAGIPPYQADYVVDVLEDVDALCSFQVEVIPRLREHGWTVEVDRGFQCQVPTDTTKWYGAIDKQAGWFGLELGVEIDGERVDLLPALIELLEQHPKGQGLDAFAHSRKRHVAVPLGGDRYLPVPPSRLAKILRVLIEMHDGPDGGGLRLPVSAVGQLPLLQEAVVDEIRWDGDVGLAEAGASLLRGDAPVVVQPHNLNATLRPYQRTGVAWLQQLRTHAMGGVLADDMGLGKTLQTIAHLLREKNSGRLVRSCLLICPTSLIDNWLGEMRKFAPSLRTLRMHGPKRRRLWDAGAEDADVIVTSYPLLLRDYETLADRDYHYVVLDEAQAIKNHRSRVSQAVRRLRSEHRLALTGTPIENRVTELWSLFDFLNPNLLGGVTAFRELYQKPIEQQGSESHLRALQERVAPFILRRLKSEVATELPPKTLIVKPVELEGEQRDLYEATRMAAHQQVRKVLQQREVGQSSIDILSALLKLRQICCDPRLLDMRAANAVAESAKLDALLEMLDELLPRGHRVLVFSQFTRMLRLISAALDKRGTEHLMLTGASKNRQDLVDRFQGGEGGVFLLSLKAAGTGLTLTGADTVIHYDPWWNPAIQAQATDRAYRIGQTKPVFVYNLVVAGSVEQRILDLQERKRRMADTILEPQRALANLDVGEVESLFAPLKD